MIVRVEVEGDRPYMPGTALVYVNGAVIAKLRTGESVTIETSEDYTTSVVTPLGLNDAECPLGTPGCRSTGCGPHRGGSCSSPDAPQHIDMGI